MKKQNNYSSFIWAGVLVVLGLYFLLKNFGLISFRLPTYLISWRIIPFIIGINALTKQKYFEGIFAIGLSIFFFAPDFISKEAYQTYSKLWPLLLVVAGGAIVYKRLRPTYPDATFKNKQDVNTRDKINETYIMSGGNKKITSSQFSGGRILCVMGGSQMDLTNANLNAPALIDIFVLMGGVELRIPKEWNVQVDVLPIMGGVEDKITTYPDHVVNPAQRLVISGNIVMGGLEIKRY